MTRPLLLSTLAEAAAWLAQQTGRGWTESEVLNAAARHGIELSAAPPLSAVAAVQELVIPIDTEQYPTGFRKVRSLGWCMAKLYGMNIGQIIAGGETETAHAVSPVDIKDGQLTMFDTPVRVTRDQVRVSHAAITAILQKYRKAEPQWRHLYRPQADATPAEPIAAPPPSDAAPARDHDEELADLFDPVPITALEAMFPDGGKWAGYAEKARANGLIAARSGRAKFNPYRAAFWWFNRGAPGWKWERCLRVLANNLPARSRDSKSLLTGEVD